MSASRCPAVVVVWVVAALLAGACSAERPDLVAVSDDGAPGTTAPATTAPVTTAPVNGTVTGTSDEACSGPTAGLHEITVVGGGVAHPVRIVVPTSFAGTRLPVVIAFHGLGSTGADEARLSGYEELAEQEGFIAVHPTAVANGDDTRTAWQLATPADGTNADDHDDLAFADALIDEVVATWCADAARVYVAGMSNGGFFVARLVCERADRIAAAVTVAGLFHPDGCAPARPVPYLAFHGTADEFVPFDGSGESVLLAAGASLPQEFFTTDMPAAFAEFAAGAGCDAVPIDTPLELPGGSTMIRHTYEGCDDAVPMAFVEVIGGGHTWPGADGVPPAALDATLDGWAFMSAVTLPG